jgi:hypothetical protein
MMRRIHNLITDIAAYVIWLAVETNHQISRVHSHHENIIEELAQEINAWDALYQTTRQQLAVQTLATERLLAMLEPLTKDPTND